MGLLDRDYYRDDEGGPIAAWLRHGLATKVLVVVNAIAFLVQISTEAGSPNSGPFTEALGLVGDRVLRGEVWRLVTYGFLNSTAALAPFLVNLLLLWVAGHEAEERLGRQRFVAFYLFAAIAGGLAMAGAAAAGLAGAGFDQTLVVGSTAPITGLLVWLLFQSPRLRLTFFYSLGIPIRLILLLVVLFDAYGLLLSQIRPLEMLAADGRRLTLVGHVAAALAGLSFHLLLRQVGGKRRRRVEPRSDPDLRIYREEAVDAIDDEPQPAAVASAPELDEHLEAQLDAVLAKVAAQGQLSLTGAEREILKRASEVYRKRRR